jgi:hypothetical protein
VDEEGAMSATPRPWVIDYDAPDATMLYRQEGRHRTLPVAQFFQSAADAVYSLRAVNAFDALLAVAKAAVFTDEGTERHRCPICGIADHNRRLLPDDDECPILTLDAVSPGWREW